MLQKPVYIQCTNALNELINEVWNELIRKSHE